MGCSLYPVLGKDLFLELVPNTVPEIGMLPGLSRVMYDLISKPAGTTEWNLETNCESAGECHDNYHYLCLLLCLSQSWLVCKICGIKL